MDNRRQPPTAMNADGHVRVVGHDDEREKIVADAMEAKPVVQDDAREPPIAKQARSMSRIQVAFLSLSPFPID